MNQDDLEYVRNSRKSAKTGAIIMGLVFILIGIILTRYGMWLFAIPLFWFGAWRLSVGIRYKI